MTVIQIPDAALRTRVQGKRSSNLRLVLMAAAVPMALGACDSEPTGQVLSSVDQCRVQTEVPAAQCEAGYNKAVEEHARLAPRFASKVECDAQFDNCAVAPGDGSGQQAYMPPMGGFLLGYLIGNSLGGNRGYAVGGASPLYRDYRTGGYLKPNGDLASRGIGNVSGARGNTALPARAMTVSRAGFGSSASARGGFGSGRGGYGG